MTQTPQELNLNLPNEKERKISTNKKLRITIKYSLIAVMTALITISTLFFVIPIPATKGFFNVGEIFVYVTAIIFGPYIGAIAGGIGSALGDIFLNYPYFAPVTFIAKGMEGFLVGMVFKWLKNTQLDKKKKFYASFFGFLSGIIIALVGNSLGWVIIGSIFAILIITISFLSKYEVIIKIISIICGGSFMVLTYLLAEYYIFDFGIAAFIEIPVNITQVIIGMLVAIPLTELIAQTKIIESFD